MQIDLQRFTRNMPLFRKRSLFSGWPSSHSATVPPCLLCTCQLNASNTWKKIRGKQASPDLHYTPAQHQQLHHHSPLLAVRLVSFLSFDRIQFSLRKVMLRLIKTFYLPRPISNRSHVEASIISGHTQPFRTEGKRDKRHHS